MSNDEEAASSPSPVAPDPAPVRLPASGAIDVLSGTVVLLLVLLASTIPLTRSGSGSTLSSLEAARLVASVGGDDLRFMARAMIVVYLSALALIPAVAVGGLVGHRIRLGVSAIFGVTALLAVVLFRTRVGPAPGVIALAAVIASAPRLLVAVATRRGRASS